jgi:hypothetical protein
MPARVTKYPDVEENERREESAGKVPQQQVLPSKRCETWHDAFSCTSQRSRRAQSETKAIRNRQLQLRLPSSVACLVMKHSYSTNLVHSNPPLAPCSPYSIAGNWRAPPTTSTQSKPGRKVSNYPGSGRIVAASRNPIATRPRVVCDLAKLRVMRRSWRYLRVSDCRRQSGSCASVGKLREERTVGSD